MSGEDFWWPTEDARQEALRREIHQSRLDARRIAAKRARENRREWAKDTVVAIFLLAVAFVLFWALSGQPFPTL